MPKSPDKPAWVQKDFQVLHRKRQVEGKLEVNGATYGSLGIHPDTEEARLWTISQLSTGLAIGWFVHLDTAMEIAVALHQVAGKAMQQPTKEETIEALPEWVGPWVRECVKQCRCLDTAHFRSLYKEVKK